MLKKSLSLAAILLLAGLTASASANPFGPGNLVVARVGDGSAALTSNATATFLDEYPIVGGPLVQTLALPTSGSGSNRQFANSGTATSEAFLTLSTDGQYLTLGGYDAAVGTGSITGSNWGTINRVAARVDASGFIDTSTALSDNITGNPRSVVMNANDFWMSSSGGGVRYTTFGAVGTSVQVSPAPTNTRVANIYAGQLYISASTSSGPVYGVATIGIGLPTTSGNTTTQLPGFPTTSGPSSYDYWFAGPSTLYVADDRTVATGGGIQKWTLNAGTWSLTYTLNTGLPAGCRGLAGTLDGSGNAVLYATTAQSSANCLVTVTDTGGASAFTMLATAPANTAFRGVDFAPTPEPGTLALLVIGGLALIRRRG